MKRQTLRQTLGTGLLPKSIAAVALLSALPCLALTCEELRAEVETKIRSSGVTQFTVSIADTDANTPGKVVGSCDLGSKKLLYTAAQPSNGSATTEPTSAKAETILTECKDGSVSIGGSCRK